MGQIFKNERKKLNLTQAKFTQNIISVSQYSRVENGEQDLRASDFIKLLYINNLNIDPFFKSLNKNILSSDQILKMLAQSFYDRNLNQVQKIKNIILKIPNNNFLLLQADLIISTLNNTDVTANTDLISRFSKELNKKDNWTKDKEFLQLFGSSISVFHIDRLSIYMEQILKEYINNISNCPFELQRRIAGICINYLNKCYTEKELTLVNQTITLLANLSQDPDLLMYKLLGIYFKYLFEKNKNKTKEIIDLLKETGYNKFILNLVK